MYLPFKIIAMLIFILSSDVCAMERPSINRKKDAKALIDNDIMIANLLNNEERMVAYRASINCHLLLAQENDATCYWFNEIHKKRVQSFLQKTVKDATIEIMGSRRWQTSHLLSDIDAVVVTQADNHENVIMQLRRYYAVRYPIVEQCYTKTKAGLSLFVLKNFSDPFLGEMKLEYTIQSPQTNRLIIDQMTKKLAERFANNDEKTSYAFAMMKAVYNNDQAEQLKLKEWTPVLPISN